MILRPAESNASAFASASDHSFALRATIASRPNYVAPPAAPGVGLASLTRAAAFGTAVITVVLVGAFMYALERTPSCTSRNGACVTYDADHQMHEVKD
ncbi:MAG: hypothetical protein ABJE10_04565 [bacterium]